METMEFEAVAAQDEEDMNLIILICIDIEEQLRQALPSSADAPNSARTMGLYSAWMGSR